MTSWKELLYYMDEALYISDMETDELLFLNKRVKERGQITDASLGKPCYEVLMGKTSRCEFCPKYSIAEYSRHEKISWSSFYKQAGVYIHNSGIQISWKGGRKAYAQFSVDITQFKKAEEDTKYQLMQQELITQILASFVKTPRLELSFPAALQQVGNFLGVNIAVIYQYDAKKDSYKYFHGWFREDIIGLKVDLFQIPGDMARRYFIAKEHEYFQAEDADVPAKEFPFEAYKLKESDVLKYSIISMPIIIQGIVWGFWAVADVFSSHRWRAKDVDFTRIFSGLVDTALGREVAEQNLDMSEQMLSTVIDGLTNSIYWKNPETGIYEGGNNAFWELISKPKEDVVGRTNDDIFSKTAAEKFNITDQQALEVEGPLEYEQEVPVYSGEIVVLKSSKTVVRDAGGNPIRLIGFHEDITQRRYMEKAKQETLSRLEEVSRAKGDFLSRMSHEIRTPMNAILGMTKIGLEAEDSTKKQYSLEKIETASRHMLDLINQILDMAKIEANKLELVENEFIFSQMITNIISIMGVRADEKAQNLVVFIDENIPNRVIGDELRISQVINNLLSNAIKFTPEEGEIELGFRLEEQSEDRLQIRALVKDSGIGIAPEQQSKVFDAFEQVDGGINRIYEGTGLGLAIAKNIVSLLGGEIFLESEVGKGSEFSFNMQLRCAADENSAGEEAYSCESYDFNGKTILLAEDIDINREIVGAILKDVHINVITAENGREAVRYFMEEPEKYDLIFMDLHMPEMDGYEATKKIRELEDPKAKTIPIIAMTANVFKEDVEKCLAAGMNDHIGKPLDFNVVLQKMRQYIIG